MGRASPSRTAACCKSLPSQAIGWYRARLVFGPGAFMRTWPPPLRIAAMSRVCQITGKRPMTGNTVSHANNRRRRRFLPNLHVQRFWLESERRFVSLRVSTRGLRTIEKNGLDKVIAKLRAKGVEL